MINYIKTEGDGQLTIKRDDATHEFYVTASTGLERIWTSINIHDDCTGLKVHFGPPAHTAPTQQPMRKGAYTLIGPNAKIGNDGVHTEATGKNSVSMTVDHRENVHCRNVMTVAHGEGAVAITHVGSAPTVSPIPPNVRIQSEEVYRGGMNLVNLICSEGAKADVNVNACEIFTSAKSKSPVIVKAYKCSTIKFNEEGPDSLTDLCFSDYSEVVFMKATVFKRPVKVVMQNASKMSSPSFTLESGGYFKINSKSDFNVEKVIAPDRHVVAKIWNKGKLRCGHVSADIINIETLGKKSSGIVSKSAHANVTCIISSSFESYAIVSHVVCPNMHVSAINASHVVADWPKVCEQLIMNAACDSEINISNIESHPTVIEDKDESSTITLF